MSDIIKSYFKKMLIILGLALAVSFLMSFTNDESFIQWVVKTSILLFGGGIFISGFGFYQQGFSGPTKMANFDKGYDEQTDIKTISSNFKTGITVLISAGILYLISLAFPLVK